MIKIWLFYLGYFILLAIFFYLLIRIIKTKPEIKDYGLLTKILVRWRLWRAKTAQKIPERSQVQNFFANLQEKILRRIKVEALKVEIWASERLAKKKNNQNLNEL